MWIFDIRRVLLIFFFLVVGRHTEQHPCEFTVEFAAHQLHAQGACLTAHNRDNTDVLSDDWGVKQVGLSAVIVNVPHKHLW